MAIRLLKKSNNGISPTAAQPSNVEGLTGRQLTQRQFLKSMAAAVGLAGLGVVASPPRTARAAYTAGTGGAHDTVDNNLDITGTVTITGNLGVGTSIPSQRLDVRGSIALGTNGDQGLISETNGLRLDVYDNGATDFVRFTQGATEWARIVEGKMTLGAWPGSPRSVLDVTGSGAQLGLYWDQGSGSARVTFSLSDSGDVTIATNSAGSRMILSPGSGTGNVGLGTSSPSEKLHVNDGAVLISSTGNLLRLNRPAVRTYNVAIDSSVANNPLVVSQELTPVLAINDAGKVGIGTTTPAVAFDVVGDVQASSSIKVSGVVAIDGNAVARQSYYAP